MAWQSSGYRGAGQYRDIRGTDEEISSREVEIGKL